MLDYFPFTEEQKTHYESLFLNKWEKYCDDNVSIFVAVNTNGSLESKIVKAYETNIFNQTLGKNHTPEVMYNELYEYENRSTYYIAFNKQNIIGVARSIEGTMNKNSTVKVFNQLINNETIQTFFQKVHNKPLTLQEIMDFHAYSLNTKCSEFATMGVLSEFLNSDLSHEAFKHLVSAIAKHGLSCDTEIFLTETHEGVKKMVEYMGLKTSPICNLPSYKSYEGDMYEDYAYHIDIHEANEQYRKYGKHNEITKLYDLVNTKHPFYLIDG